MNKNFITILLLLVLVLYSRTLNFPHLKYWDNPGFSYTHNSVIKSLNFDHLQQMFTQSFDNHYHPLTLISLAVEYNIGNGNALYFRLTNLIIYILICTFLYIFVYLLLKDNNAAFLISLFFAVHPFNVESVVWISEQKNLLFMLFLIPSMIFYLKYIEHEKLQNLILSSLLFILSLLSKSQGLPMIGILFLLDYIKGQPLNKRSFYKKTPYLIIALIFLFTTIYFHVPENFTRTHPHQWSDYFFSGFHNIFFYIVKTYIPFNFSPYYPYPSNTIISFWYYPLIFLSVIFLIIRYLKNNKLIIFGLTLYFISIFPLLKFISIPYGNYIAADRHMILPLIGLAFVSWGAAKNFFNIKYIKIITFSFIILLFVQSYNYCDKWENSLSFYTYLSNEYPELSSAWGNKGRANMDLGNYNNAVQDFNKAIKIKNGSSNLFLNRGLAYIHMGKADSALNDFSNAIKLDSGNYAAYSNRALTNLKLNNLNDAYKDITCCIIIQPDFAEGWANKAYIEFKLNDYNNALQSIDKSILLNFSQPDLLYSLKDQIIKQHSN